MKKINYGGELPLLIGSMNRIKHVSNFRIKQELLCKK